MFSTCCEGRAQDLIVAACETNVAGEYTARELIREQTIENLELFSTRLDETHDRLPPCWHCNGEG